MKNKKTFIIFIFLISLLFNITNVYAADYQDDIYDGDYSLKEMLQNYNVITLGKKELDNNMPIGNISPGSARIYHVNSRFLVNGNLRVFRMDLFTDSDDLKSYAQSLTHQDSVFYCGYCGNALGEEDSCSCGINTLNSDNLSNKLYSRDGINGDFRFAFNGNGRSNTPAIGEYINFDRLYDSITSDQGKIKKGRLITEDNGVAHIETGGEYYIDDINGVDSFMFDSFEANKDNLTIITINNSGSINFPKIFESTDNGDGNLVPTNDYIGMERPNYFYASNYVLDNYYGNIIWNVPNASYIELPSAPFIGHLIAPKADVKGPELHYAGAFIVNSLYLEGSSEAHFYPLTSTNIPYRSNLEPVKAKPIASSQQGRVFFNNNVNPEELEEGMVVSFSIEPEDNYVLKNIEIKDEEDNNVPYTEIKTLEYEFTMPATNVTITPQFKDNNIINQIITNPKTGSNIMLVLGIIFIGFVFGFRIIKKEKNKIM